MTVAAASAPRTELDTDTLAKAQRDYEAALPRITAHAKVNFGFIRDPGRRDDAVANVVGIGWKHWLSALRHGKDPNEFVSSIAEMSVRQVRSGRRLDRQERPNDVLSPRAQRLRDFVVKPLPAVESGVEDNETVDALEDHTATPPGKRADVGGYDVAPWFESLGARDAAIARDMMTGEGTADLAQRYGVSPARVSQLRREFHKAWEQFHEGGKGR